MKNLLLKRRFFHLKWFSYLWYEYLFEKPIGYWAEDYTNWFNRVWCRMGGHPEGVWYTNSCGSEPDMTCKNCGDNLG